MSNGSQIQKYTASERRNICSATENVKYVTALSLSRIDCKGRRGRILESVVLSQSVAVVVPRSHRRVRRRLWRRRRRRRRALSPVCIGFSPSLPFSPRARAKGQVRKECCARCVAAHSSRGGREGGREGGKEGVPWARDTPRTTSGSINGERDRGAKKRTATNPSNTRTFPWLDLWRGRRREVARSIFSIFPHFPRSKAIDLLTFSAAPSIRPSVRCVPSPLLMTNASISVSQLVRQAGWTTGEWDEGRRARRTDALNLVGRSVLGR